MFRNLLFDWSGTIVDDLATTLDATNSVFNQYGLPAFSLEQFRAEFQLPYPDFYKKTMPGVDLEELEEYFRAAFVSSHHPVLALPHAREFLVFCRENSIRCFVFTSMATPDFSKQARELELEIFFEKCYSGVRNKKEKIHDLLADLALLPAETAFIGDMQHDIETAKLAEITSIGVLTGYNDAKQLAQAMPDMIVPDLLSLGNLLRKAVPDRV